ncbi:MAG TPA: benzoate/H(+) symporter BenE family transporter [Thermoleophilaceae bacterium]
MPDPPPTAVTESPGLSVPLLAGALTTIVGFASSFTVVLAGLHAVGADERQASSGLLALCVATGILSTALSLRQRMPLFIAWSTPGAALLVSAGAVSGGYPAALGAFVVTGLLIAVTGLWSGLGRWIAAIPVPLASAMLAGVLLPLCVAPVEAAVEIPGQAAPVLVTWIVLVRFARRWAVVGAIVAAVVVIVASESIAGGDSLLPTLTATAPTFDLGAIVGLAIPLFIVTMTSQNIAGMGVLASFGYRPSLRPILVSTGAATVVAAPFGAHAINLAAITAALVAGPDAGPDPRRRWVASVTAGLGFVVLGLAAGIATALIAASPPLLIEAVAGLALLGAFGGALRTATEAEGELREAAVVTFVVSASGVTALSVSAAFWGLVAGLVFLAIRRGG